MRKGIYDEFLNGGKEGFIDHRGRFLDREKAATYARDNLLLKDMKLNRKGHGVEHWGLHGTQVKEK